MNVHHMKESGCHKFFVPVYTQLFKSYLKHQTIFILRALAPTK